MRLLLTVILWTCLLSGCNDPKAANKSNFMKVLEKHYSENKECIRAPGKEFPIEERVGMFTNHNANALVEAGLISTEKFVRKVNGLLPSIGGGSPKIDANFVKYSLTEIGRKYLDDGKFCYGRRKPLSVERFSPPVATFGNTISQIEFVYKVVDMPSWARNASLRKQFPKVESAIQAETSSTKDAVVARLMSDGWQLEKPIMF